MTDVAIAITPQPTRQAIAAKGRSAPGKVTGKVKRAVDDMVWLASRRDDAAQAAGLSVHGLREALRKPHVRAYYLAQLEVLRTSERARNIHTLAEVRDQDSNQMARVAAVKALEQLEDQPHSAAARNAAPGFVIQIVNTTAEHSHTPHMRADDAKPLISNEPAILKGYDGGGEG